MTDGRVSELAFEIEKLHHGTPSGIDNTVVTFARPVYFIKDRPVQTFKVGRAFTLVIGDTGIAAPTRAAVGDVRKLWEADRTGMERVFDKIGGTVERARASLESGKIEALGALMDEDHALLQQLSVSSPELDKLVEAARRAGAEGAKLSGGGRGGNMIALVQPGAAGSIAEALQAAGAKGTITTTIDP
jgi:mevalonate kinase